MQDFSELSIYLAGTVYSALFRPWESRGCEEEEWYLTSVTSLPKDGH